MRARRTRLARPILQCSAPVVCAPGLVRQRRPGREGRYEVPAEQAGSISGGGKRFSVRYRDANGKQRRQSGFRSRAEAARWLADRVEDVQRERRGDTPKRRGELPTYDQVCDEMLAAHTGERNTIETLRNRLRSSRKAFGSTRVDRVTVQMVLTWRRSVPELSRWHETKCVRQAL